MKIGKIQFSKFVLFWLVLLPIYQDSPLSQYLGAAGYTIIMPLSLIMIAIYMLVINRLPKNEHLHRLVRLGIWLLIVSYVAIIVWLILGNSFIVVSEFLPYKALKVCLQYFSYSAYIALIIITARSAGTKSIGKYSFITLVVLAIVCVIEKQSVPYAFESLHFAGAFPYWRIRLLTTESSWTAMMIFTYTFLTLFWTFRYKKRICGIIGIVCVVYLLWTTGSKTLLIAIPTMAIVYVIVSLRRLNIKSIVAFLLSAVAMVVFVQVFLPQLSSAFQGDIQNYSSVATRLYTGIVGLFIGMIFPFGVGGAVYLGVFQSALSNYMWIFDKLPIRLNTNEVIALATRSTDQALTVKSGILHNNMYWGILGTIYLFADFAKISKSIMKYNIEHKEVLISAFWSAIVLLIYASGFSFEFWLLYAFLVCMEEEMKHYYAMT